MAITAQEKAWVSNFQIELTKFSDSIMWLRSMVEYYINEGYNTSLLDADLAEVDPSLTQAKLTNGVNMVLEVGELMDNQPVTQGDWQTNLDQMRKL